MTNYCITLRSRHWKRYGIKPEFAAKQAANNSPPMRMGGRTHDDRGVLLLKEAYNHIRVRHNLAHLPALDTNNTVFARIYDLNTATAISKFQRHYGLSSDGVSGMQTISKMDALLLEIGSPAN